MKDTDSKSLRDEILNNNKMLFRMKNASCMETCMCWGLEVPDSWLHVLEHTCRYLEGLNYLAYLNHRVRIQASQVKSKFGGLRFYYDIVADPPAWICWYENAVDKIFSKLSKLDFRTIRVHDKDAYDEIVIDEVPDSKYEEELEYSKNVSNVEVYIDENGKKTKKTTFHHYETSHQEPTRFKLIYKIARNRWQIKNFLRKILNWQPTDAQLCITELLDKYAADAVRDAEEECEHYCEKCGAHIYDGNEYSPRCQTLGWVSFLCKKCASESGQSYVCNGALMQNGKVVIPKEEYCKKIEEEEEA